MTLVKFQEKDRERILMILSSMDELFMSCEDDCLDLTGSEIHELLINDIDIDLYI